MRVFLCRTLRGKKKKQYRTKKIPPEQSANSYPDCIIAKAECIPE